MRESRITEPTSREVAAEVLAATLCRLLTSGMWIGVPPPSPIRPRAEPGTLVARRCCQVSAVHRRAAGEVEASAS